MNDRELLKAAAKAAGLESARYVEDWFDQECFSTKGIAYDDGVSEWLWNPLENDADAFRLMVDLKMKVQSIGTREQVRRAIVSVAAQMVKT